MIVSPTQHRLALKMVETMIDGKKKVIEQLSSLPGSTVVSTIFQDIVKVNCLELEHLQGLYKLLKGRHGNER